MQFKIEIEEAQQIPKYYGIAWNQYCKNTSICYPIPFNFIIGWIYCIIGFLKHGPKINKFICNSNYYDVITRLKCDLSEFKELVSEKRVNERGLQYYIMIIKEIEGTLINLGEINVNRSTK